MGEAIAVRPAVVPGCSGHSVSRMSVHRALVQSARPTTYLCRSDRDESCTLEDRPGRVVLVAGRRFEHPYALLLSRKATQLLQHPNQRSGTLDWPFSEPVSGAAPGACRRSWKTTCLAQGHYTYEGKRWFVVLPDCQDKSLSSISQA